MSLSDHSTRSRSASRLKRQRQETVWFHVGQFPSSIPIDDAHDITLLVAELKAKAAGATSSGVEKFHNVKDRHTRYAAKVVPFLLYP